VVAGGEADEMGVGGILEVGFRRISCLHIVGKETVGRTVLKAEQGLVCVLPGCGISGTEADTEKSQLDDGTSVEFIHCLKPAVCRIVVGMGGPAAGEQEIDIEKPAHRDSSRSCFTCSGVMAGAPIGAESK